MKKTLKLLVFVSLLLVAFTATAWSAEKLLQFGTSGSGGTLYYIGSGISEVMNKYVPEVKVTPVATAGGVSNLRKIGSKQLDFAGSVPIDLKTVFNDGTVKPEDIRVVGAINSNATVLVCRPDAPWDTFDQAFHKGVRVGIGEPGNPIQATVKTYLKIVGLTMDDIKPFPISQNEMADALKDKRIELACMGGGVPLPAIVDVATSLKGVKIMNLSKKNLEDQIKENPYQIPITIPANTYMGQKKDVQVIGYYTLVTCRADLPEDLVYKLTKAMYDHPDEIGKIHLAGKEIVPQNALKGADFAILQLKAKFHPGAIKYLKEKGVWNPKYE